MDEGGIIMTTGKIWSQIGRVPKPRYLFCVEINGNKLYTVATSFAQAINFCRFRFYKKSTKHIWRIVIDSAWCIRKV